MRSWLARLGRGRGTEAAEPAPADPAAARGRPVLEVLTSDTAIAVEVDADGERITDILNGRDTLSVLDDHDQPRAEIDVEEILLAFPPPHQGDRRRRLHRPRQPLRIRVGPYQVAGHVHVPPGAQATGYLMRARPRFVAVTEAVISVEDPEPIERYADVVIVNLRRAHGIEEISAEDAETPPQSSVGTDPGST